MAYNSTTWTTGTSTTSVSSSNLSLYAYFGSSGDLMSGLSLGTHYAIPFQNTFMSSGQNDVDFGTGTNPATTFTTADTDTQYASQIVPMMWYVPDDIYIDAVYAIEGADNATGDTTRMHLMSYAYTSGSTSTLADGTVLAANSDVTNAGNEQTYLSTWTVSSNSVAEGRVILAFVRADSVNSDYSLNIIVKYHLT